MITFIVLAAALTLAACAVIAVPLLKRGGESGLKRAPWALIGAVAVLAVGATASYLSLSNWSWARASSAESGQRTMVSRLARTLWHHPNDLEGWEKLGQVYMDMQQPQTDLAVRAYQRAYKLSSGRDPNVLIGLAEALTMQDESSLNGRAGKLIEKALVLEPDSPQALFFGAAAAVHRGDLPLARQRFTALLALNPPDSVKPMIEKEIQAIDQKMAQAPAGSGPAGSSSPASVPSAPGAASTAGAAGSGGSGAAEVAQASGPAGLVAHKPGDPAPHTAPRAAIHIRVALSPKLRMDPAPNEPLYVFVRDPKRPGPPLAVKRLLTHFPQIVELTSADAMIAGRGIVPGEDVEVVARISRSGNPMAQKGDPFGEVAYHVRRDGTVDVTIDRLTP